MLTLSSYTGSLFCITCCRLFITLFLIHLPFDLPLPHLMNILVVSSSSDLDWWIFWLWSTANLCQFVVMFVELCLKIFYSFSSFIHDVIEGFIIYFFVNIVLVMIKQWRSHFLPKTSRLPPSPGTNIKLVHTACTYEYLNPWFVNLQRVRSICTYICICLLLHKSFDTKRRVRKEHTTVVASWALITFY